MTSLQNLIIMTMAKSLTTIKVEHSGKIPKKCYIDKLCYDAVSNTFAKLSYVKVCTDRLKYKCPELLKEKVIFRSRRSSRIIHPLVGVIKSLSQHFLCLLGVIAHVRVAVDSILENYPPQ